MNRLLARLLAIVRGQGRRPPAQIEAETGAGLSPDRLDAALRRLREQSEPPADEPEASGE